jgi:hypothetical protein
LVASVCQPSTLLEAELLDVKLDVRAILGAFLGEALRTEDARPHREMLTVEPLAEFGGFRDFTGSPGGWLGYVVVVRGLRVGAGFLRLAR